MKKDAFQLLKETHFHLIAFVFLLLPMSGFSQWQATMKSSLDLGEMEYTIYSDLNQYCLEFGEDDSKGIVIVNPQENITSILFTKNKQVRYVPTNSEFSLKNDPVQAYNYYLQKGEEKVEANEMIEGYDCKKMTIYSDGEAIFTQWFSEELNFPIKQLLHSSDNSVTYLQNIQSWKCNADKFVVPEEYIEVDKNRVPVNR